MKPCLISSHLRFCGTLALSLLSGAASTASEMSADAPLVLDPIEVHSTRGESYNVKHAAVATKTDTPLLDTPQSVSVLSKVHRLEVLKGASTKSPETVIPTTTRSSPSRAAITSPTTTAPPSPAAVASDARFVSIISTIIPTVQLNLRS